MSSKLRKAIGAVKDQTSIGLALVAKNNSSNLEIAILKATTHDAVPIEEKYVKEILQHVSSSKHYAAACAQAIARRIGRTRKWIVALKSLMLVLRIFQDGDLHFPCEVLLTMKSGGKILNLSSFRDDSNSSPWDFTAYIRTFALYLDKRLEGFLTGKLQRRAVYKEEMMRRRSSGQRSRNESVCDMKPPVLLDRIAHWQCLLDRAIATRPTGAAKYDRMVQISLYSIARESFDLYRDISDGLALLLDSFFHLQYQSCSDAFEACIKASKQFDELGGFYALCKEIGAGRSSEYPSVQKISDELIDTLREFLKDSASFPTGAPKPPLQPAAYLLLPSPSPPPPDCSASTSGRLETVDRNSNVGSEIHNRHASLEDLISVTDAGGYPSKSMDEYQYEKFSRFDELTGVDTNSNANMNTAWTPSMDLDLVFFDDDDDVQHPSQSIEYATSEGREGWELVLAETASDISMPSSAQASSRFEPSLLDSLESLYSNQALVVQPQQPIYNPFLQDTCDIAETSTFADIGETSTFADIAEISTFAAPQAAFDAIVAVSDTSSPLPTFQATPTFSAQVPDDFLPSKWPVEDDPFAPLPSPTAQILESSTNQQQQLLLEQQLWLQNQNEIIARHVNIT